MTKLQQARENASSDAPGTSLKGEQCACDHATWDHADGGKGKCQHPGCGCTKFEEDRA